jgi:hypothetical protein
LSIEKINPRPYARIQEQNLIPDKQWRSKIAGVESFISIQVTQNARIDDPEKLNLRDSTILNQGRICALPKETPSDQTATKELEPRGSHGQLMEDRAPPEGSINRQDFAGGAVLRHGSVPGREIRRLVACEKLLIIGWSPGLFCQTISWSKGDYPVFHTPNSKGASVISRNTDVLLVTDHWLLIT